MKVIGLTGGVGSGKSQVAQIMKAEFEASLLIADELGNEAMKPGTKGYYRIIERFGQEVVQKNGELDRNALARIIFQDNQARRDINGIVHPIVMDYIRNYIVQREKDSGIIVLESALLFESSCDRLCDEVWYICVPEEVRRERLIQNRGYSRRKTDTIMANQLSEEEFIRRSHRILDNNDTPQALLEKINLIMNAEQDT